MELSNDNLRKEDNDQQVLDTVIETQRGPILSHRENEIIAADYTNSFSNSFNLKKPTMKGNNQKIKKRNKGEDIKTEGFKSLLGSNTNSPLWASNKKIIQIKIEVSPDKNDYQSSQRSMNSFNKKKSKNKKRRSDSNHLADQNKNLELNRGYKETILN